MWGPLLKQNPGGLPCCLVRRRPVRRGLGGAVSCTPARGRAAQGLDVGRSVVDGGELTPPSAPLLSLQLLASSAQHFSGGRGHNPPTPPPVSHSPARHFLVKTRVLCATRFHWTSQPVFLHSV